MGPGAQEYKAENTYGTSGISTGMPEYELTLALSAAAEGGIGKQRVQ